MIDLDDTVPETGIGVTIHGNGVLDSNLAVASDRLALTIKEVVNRWLVEAELKFGMYLDHRKVVLLEFNGDRMPFDDDDAKEIINENDIATANW